MSRREQRARKRALAVRRTLAETPQPGCQADAITPKAGLACAHWQDGKGQFRRSDIGVIMAAITQQYPVDDDTREEVILAMRAMLDAEKPGVRVAAARAIIAADALNAAREKAAADAGRPTTVNIFERIQVLHQQLTAPASQQIAQEAAPSHDLAANEQSAGQAAISPHEANGAQ